MEIEKNELEILFPDKKITVAGEEISLRPFPFGKWPEIIKKISGIMGIAIEAYNISGGKIFDIKTDDQTGQVEISPLTVNLFIDLLTKGGEEILDILAISARKPREWVDALEAEDGLNLLVGTVLANKDFFTSKAAPLFKKMLPQIQVVKPDSPGVN